MKTLQYLRAKDRVEIQWVNASRISTENPDRNCDEPDIN